MKNCSHITTKFYFGSQKFFIVGRVAIQFFLRTNIEFIPDIIMFSDNSSLSIKKILPFSMNIMNFYIRTRFLRIMLDGLIF